MTKPVLFSCSSCGMKYSEKKWAEKCHAWCSAHNSCNIEIIRHAVKR